MNDNKENEVAFFWFRRDLRLEDNHGLYQALQLGLPVQCVFIFDENILKDIINKKDARVSFIYNTLKKMNEQLKELSSSLLVDYGSPQNIWKKWMSEYNINTIYCNHDYEPYAKERDKKIAKIATTNKTNFETYKDHVIYEGLEISKKDGTPYTVFTPYSKKWKALLLEQNEKGVANYNTKGYEQNYMTSDFSFPNIESMGFELNDSIKIPPISTTQKLIKNYDKNRDFPGVNGTSKLGIHFRFGTISIREKVRKAKKLNETYLNELIWRDFYAMIIDNFPIVVTRSFRKKYEWIEWRNNEQDFEAWKIGKTGYPLVDAGMRELNESGYMHNRVRMVVASFLCKHLLIDWRWGEAYFAEKLLDFDLASNNGGWQWAAGCGTDAAPYFRIFNPTTQMTKFDKELVYINKWIPEYGTSSYPEPIVEHKNGKRTLFDGI